MSAIEAKEILKNYGNVAAVRDVTFTVEPGEIIGLLGPNGAGKTTLMKILTGYLQPDGGDICVGGHDVLENPLAAQREIGYLPEHAPLYSEMNVQEYLVFMASMRGIDETKHVDALSKAVYATALEDYLTRPIHQLSKGYRQRVGIAQAILHEPDLLILDEPTTGLDPTQIVEIRALIRRLAQHSTIVLSTHILSEVEMTCERVLIMMRGELREDAKLAELQASNAAIVSVAEDALDVAGVLKTVAGVERVESIGAGSGFQRWRVSGGGEADLCPLIHDAVRAQQWRIAELRADQRTLETVFRDLAEQQADTAAASA